MCDEDGGVGDISVKWDSFRLISFSGSMLGDVVVSPVPVSAGSQLDDKVLYAWYPV